MRLILVATALALCLSTSASAASIVAGPTHDAGELDFLARINQSRVAGVNTGVVAGPDDDTLVNQYQPTQQLQAHPQLAAAAHRQAVWVAGLTMEQTRGWTPEQFHAGDASRGPLGRAWDAGWPQADLYADGENIVMGISENLSAIEHNKLALAAWEESDGHASTMHGSQWVYAGVGTYKGVSVLALAERCEIEGCVPGEGYGQLLPPEQPVIHGDPAIKAKPYKRACKVKVMVRARRCAKTTRYRTNCGKRIVCDKRGKSRRVTH